MCRMDRALEVGQGCQRWQVSSWGTWAPCGKVGKAGMKVETPLGSAVQHWPQPCPLVLSEGGDVRAGTFGIMISEVLKWKAGWRGSRPHLVSSSPTEGADICSRPRSCILDSWRCPHLVVGPGAWTPGGEQVKHGSAGTGSRNSKLTGRSAPSGGKREKALD